MTPKECMLNLIADIVGLDDTYSGDKLNNATVWEQFMNDLFKRMETIEDDNIRQILNSITKEEFQEWIDDPTFWFAIDVEITRRGHLFKTMLPSGFEGNC
jgi:hypothetical protein